MIDRRLTLVIALLASGVSAVATSFAIYATSERFLVTSFNYIVLEFIPGWFISAVTQRFGELALELSMIFSGGVLSVILGALAVGGYTVAARFVPSYEEVGGFAVAALLIFVPAFLVVGVPGAVVPSAVVGAGVVTLFAVYPAPAEEFNTDRRTLVKSASAVVAFNVVAHGLGLVRRSQTQRSERELQERAQLLEVEHLRSEAEDGELEAEGIKPVVTDVDDFFKVDINPSPPSLDSGSWSLSITGLVEEELELDLDDVRSEEVVHEYKAIRCLSDAIDGDQLDTAIWTGVKLEDILEDASPEGEYAMLYGADEYFYSIPLDDLEESVLAFGMNGLELPEAHGYPVRVLVPDRWGKLHVKWLTDIEIIDEEEGGYWEERGWQGMGPVNAVTKIDRINRPDDRVQIVGHAYAGGRGVETVEVSVDGGDEWNEATLSDPLPNPDTVRQWVYEVDAADVGGQAEIYARTIDGEGTTQPEEEADPYPDGATGWAHRSISTD
ncbi:molybdopterin-dependent oxidoreductase [Natrarchaeobaculum sulfurireducens]|nr:molybdopterin-dependent oxidoreductase [Natrarchaeobaculum sulfurireducens]AXR82579.1 putative sulfite oxidase [Natrarchaeobaculum sulfurireducens]